MKLFLLRTENYEGADIHGLYSSREKAIESFPFHLEALDESHIEEIEVDPPGGERYEMFFYARASQNGGLETNGPIRMKPSDPEISQSRLFWDEKADVGGSIAYGSSKEEAEQKAVAGLLLLRPVWQVARSRGSSSMCEVRHGNPSYVFKWNELEGNKGYAVHEDLDTARQILFEYENTGRVLPGFVAGHDGGRK